MLSQFSFSNYKSFKKEAFLDFTAESIKDHEKSVIKDKVDGERFLPVIAIYGPNGGGKSTVLEALRYLSILLMRPFIMSQIQNNTEFESIIKRFSEGETRKSIICLILNVRIFPLVLILCLEQKGNSININFPICITKSLRKISIV